MAVFTDIYLYRLETVSSGFYGCAVLCVILELGDTIFFNKLSRGGKEISDAVC